MNQPITDEQMGKAVIAMLVESDRLRSLSNTELVAECAETAAADYLIVAEMMDRLDPDWAKEEEEAKEDETKEG